MRCNVNTHQLALPEDGADQLRERVTRRFQRFADQIDAVQLTLKDDNGPRGGRDKLCEIAIRLTHGVELRIEERSARTGRALGRAMRRARHLLSKQSKKRHQRPKGRGPIAELAITAEAAEALG